MVGIFSKSHQKQVYVLNVFFGFSRWWCYRSGSSLKLDKGQIKRAGARIRLDLNPDLDPTSVKWRIRSDLNKDRYPHPPPPPKKNRVLIKVQFR